MNYYEYSATYHGQQFDRVRALLSKIQAVDHDAMNIGRTIPSEYDLAYGTGRRLSMAVMFVDIVAFSAKPNISAAEQHLMLHSLNIFFSILLRIAADYGGEVEKNTGDGLLIYFNDGEGNPAAPGTHRAISCALTMQKVSRDYLAQAWEILGAPQLPFRISIEHGYLTIARFGIARGFKSYSAIGNPANFASKMLSKGQAGEIIMGHFAMKQLPDNWQNNYVEKHNDVSGWVFSNTNMPYPIYKFTGYWTTE